MDIENCTKDECQECENEVEIKEVSTVEEVSEVSAPAVCVLPKEDFEVLKNGFKSYYDALLRLIKTTKEKDATIAKITKELQKHREGFGKTLKKPLAVSLISFLEDNKKTLRELDSYEQSKESVEKYLGYIVSDFESILETYDIGCEGDAVTVAGKPVGVSDTPAAFEVPVIEPRDAEPVVFESDECTMASAIEFMKIGQKRVEDAIKDNALLDLNLEAYVSIASSIDANYAQAVMAPAYRNVWALYVKIKEIAQATVEKLGEESVACEYRAALEKITESVSDSLVYLGVEIIDDLSDEFDTKTCKILKIVNTDNPELDKKIAIRHTANYQLDGTTLYPSKVTVYKFVQA